MSETLPTGNCQKVHYIPTLTLFELEKVYLIEALKHHNNNKYQAAQSLGIAVKTLFNRLHKYGLFEEYKLHFHDPRGRKAKK